MSGSLGADFFASMQDLSQKVKAPGTQTNVEKIEQVMQEKQKVKDYYDEREQQNRNRTESPSKTGSPSINRSYEKKPDYNGYSKQKESRSFDERKSSKTGSPSINRSYEKKPDNNGYSKQKGSGFFDERKSSTTQSKYTPSPDKHNQPQKSGSPINQTQSKAYFPPLPSKEPEKDKVPQKKSSNEVEQQPSLLVTESKKQLQHIQKQIEQTEFLLELLKTEEKRLLENVQIGSPSNQVTTQNIQADKTNTNSKKQNDVILDVMCILPNGVEEWIHISKEEDPIPKAKELTQKYSLSEESEKKLLAYIKQVQEL
ncbi:Uncharacterized protein QTN25_005298 [Entamoeba marina]